MTPNSDDIPVLNIVLHKNPKKDKPKSALPKAFPVARIRNHFRAVISERVTINESLKAAEIRVHSEVYRWVTAFVSEMFRDVIKAVVSSVNVDSGKKPKIDINSLLALNVKGSIFLPFIHVLFTKEIIESEPIIPTQKKVVGDKKKKTVTIDGVVQESAQNEDDTIHDHTHAEETTRIDDHPTHDDDDDDHDAVDVIRGNNEPPHPSDATQTAEERESKYSFELYLENMIKEIVASHANHEQLGDLIISSRFKNKCSEIVYNFIKGTTVAALNTLMLFKARTINVNHMRFIVQTVYSYIAAERICEVIAYTNHCSETYAEEQKRETKVRSDRIRESQRLKELEAKAKAEAEGVEYVPKPRVKPTPKKATKPAGEGRTKRKPTEEESIKSIAAMMAAIQD